MKIAVAALAAALAVSALGAQAQATTRLVYDGRIAFSTGLGITSMNVDGAGEWLLDPTAVDTQPAWSPDGSQLAVVRPDLGIIVMQPDGSGARLVVRGWLANPAWSPDGTQIAYDDSGGAITVVQADGTYLTDVVINPPNGVAAHPTWSPDGRKIAFAASDPGTGAQVIDIKDLTSGTVTTLPEQSASEPAWSPTGSQIAFAWQGWVAIANADGSDPRPIGNGNDGDPAWSPDGHTLVYSENGQIWAVDASGNGRHPLTGGSQDGFPSWQPLGPPPAGCTVWGTDGNDVLIGTPHDDLICGLAGNDRLMGLGGHDILEGGPGNDRLAGGPGTDYLEGDRGNDVLDARDGQRDELAGGRGNDTAITDGPIDQIAEIERVVVDRDLAAWRPATDSGELPGESAQNAFDGDSSSLWNGGAAVPAWVQTDLGQREQIGSVRLVTAGAAGAEGPLLLGSATAAGPFRLLHAFRGPTVDNEQVAFAPRRPWRDIRYLRVTVVSESADGTAAIRELAAYAPRATKKKSGP